MHMSLHGDVPSLSHKPDLRIESRTAACICGETSPVGFVSVPTLRLFLAQNALQSPPVELDPTTSTTLHGTDPSALTERGRGKQEPLSFSFRRLTRAAT